METRLPETLIEVIRYYSDKDVCRELLASMRWPEGVSCPHCESREVTFMPSVQRWNCKGCRKQFSVIVGTVFEDSHIGLDLWFTAMWLLSNAKNGVSSCELARSLGITQKTAWFMLHRIREAMEQGTVEKMKGTVEVDETYIGQKSKTMHADKRQEMRERGFPKTIVFGLRERDGEVRTMVVADTTADSLQSEIVKNVEAGSTVCTDSWKGYNGLSAAYEHGIVDHKKGQYVSGENGEYSTNGMEGYWNLLKRGYHGTYVQFSPQHTHRYLAEEDYRYNTRTDTDGQRFAKSLSENSESLRGRHGISFHADPQSLYHRSFGRPMALDRRLLSCAASWQLWKAPRNRLPRDRQCHPLPARHRLSVAQSAPRPALL